MENESRGSEHRLKENRNYGTSREPMPGQKPGRHPAGSYGSLQPPAEQGIAFTNEETGIIIDALSETMTGQEKQRLEMLRNMIL